MKIQVLLDNRTQQDEFECEHDLCINIETENYTYSLKTGTSDIFIYNAAQL